jgi:hypothetical protein
VCVRSLIYPACKVHVPYCHLWPVQLYNIFPHYLTNGKIFEKNDRTYNVYFDFLYKFLSESFLILRRIQLGITINVHRYNRYSCHILGKLEFSWEIFEKYPTIKIRKNPSSGSQVVPCGRTHGHTDTTKLNVALLNFAKAPKDTLRCGSECPVRFRIWSATYFEAHKLGTGHKYI